MSDTPKYKYILYSYFRSSCSARIRIAAHLKGIPLEYKYIHLVKKEQHHKDYHALNPSDSVPTLVVKDSQSGEEMTNIRQSVAILEFFEEVEKQNGVALLPAEDNPLGRARVRELVNIMTSDVQPVTNLRVLNFIKPFNIEPKEWQQHFMKLGFQAYEELVKIYGGKYSVGDSVTLADCALAPAVDGALRFGVDVQGEFPHVWRVWEEIKQLDAFQKGRWDNQTDTPDDLRAKAAE
jgi:maleylacetoacetate isomerase